MSSRFVGGSGYATHLPYSAYEYRTGTVSGHPESNSDLVVNAKLHQYYNNDYLHSLRKPSANQHTPSRSYHVPQNVAAFNERIRDRQYNDDNDLNYSSSSPISPLVNQFNHSMSWDTPQGVTAPHGQTEWHQTANDYFNLPNSNIQHSTKQTYMADSNYPVDTANRPTKKQRTSSAKYICLFEDCNGEFSRLHDLKRHVATHHPEEARWIDCKGKGCGRTGKPQPGKEKGGFSRLDHYLEHLRKVHKKDIPKGRGSGKGVKWVSASVYAEQGEFPCKREVMV